MARHSMAQQKHLRLMKVFFPEQPDKLTFWEQYEMGQPLWLPSADFWVLADRESHNQQTVTTATVTTGCFVNLVIFNRIVYRF